MGWNLNPTILERCPWMKLTLKILAYNFWVFKIRNGNEEVKIYSIALTIMTNERKRNILFILFICYVLIYVKSKREKEQERKEETLLVNREGGGGKAKQNKTKRPFVQASLPTALSSSAKLARPMCLYELRRVKLDIYLFYTFHLQSLKWLTLCRETPTMNNCLLQWKQKNKKQKTEKKYNLECNQTNWQASNRPPK